MRENSGIRLKAGTYLDGRYRISRVLGAGGFGITYEAENVRIHRRVAIKELFCQDYMGRDTGISDNVFLYRSEDAEKLKKARKRFSREARIVSDFSEESGIVHVTDYFDANGTSYIVMEYLNGTNLRDFQMQNGPFAPEDIFRKMLPMMRTLAKLHAAGVLHLDISPDNIMVMPDGSLRLLDFGAAEEFRTGTSDEVTLKDGYAPIEQYGRTVREPVRAAAKQETDDTAFGAVNRKKAAALSSAVKEKSQDIDSDAGESLERPYLIGSWTDVYGLCATIYTCVTGKVPFSAVYRKIHDELKKPSELGIKISPRLEMILMKGLAVEPDRRIRSMAELIESTEAALPGKYDRRRKQRKVVLSSIAAAAALAAGLGYGYAWGHDPAVRFHGQDTDVLHFSAAEDMSVHDFAENREKLRDRLDVFAGARGYMWEEDGNEITVTLPAALFDGLSDEYAARQYLAASWEQVIRMRYKDPEAEDPEEEKLTWTIGVTPEEGDFTVQYGSGGENVSKSAGTVRSRSAGTYAGAFGAFGIADTYPVSSGLSGGFRNDDTYPVSFGVSGDSGSAADDGESDVSEKSYDIGGTVSERLLAALPSPVPSLQDVSFVCFERDAGTGETVTSFGSEAAISINPAAGTWSASLADVPENMRDVMVWDMTHDPLTDDFTCFAQPEVIWEGAENNLYAGAYQVDADAFGGEAIIVRYLADAPWYPDYWENDLRTSDYVKMITVLKGRLDAAGRAYALGRDRDDDKTIYLKACADAFSGLELRSILPDYFGETDISTGEHEYPDVSVLAPEGDAVISCALPLGADPADAGAMELDYGYYGIRLAWNASYSEADKSLVFTETAIKSEYLAGKRRAQLSGLLSYAGEEMLSPNLRYLDAYLCGAGGDCGKAEQMEKAGLVDEDAAAGIVSYGAYLGGDTFVSDYDTIGGGIYYGNYIRSVFTDIPSEDFSVYAAHCAGEMERYLTSCTFTQAQTVRMEFYDDEEYPDSCVVNLVRDRDGARRCVIYLDMLTNDFADAFTTELEKNGFSADSYDLTARDEYTLWENTEHTAGN